MLRTAQGVQWLQVPPPKSHAACLRVEGVPLVAKMNALCAPRRSGGNVKQPGFRGFETMTVAGDHPSATIAG